MGIDQTKERICRGGLIVLSIVTIPALIASLMRIPSLGWQPIHVLHIAAVSSVLLIGLYRDKISYNVRAWFIVSVIFLVGAGELFSFGILGSGWPYLAHATIIAAILLDTRKSIGLFAFSSILIGLGLIAFQHNLITIPVEFNAYAKETNTWTNYYTDYLLIYSTTIAAFYFLNKALLRSTHDLKALNEDLESKVEQRTRELTEANVKLKQSLEEIQTLRGIIPICSSCKKIRDDKGYWNQIESYIKQHSEAQFSHGMCPECSDKLYGDKPWYIKMKKKKQEKNI